MKRPKTEVPEEKSSPLMPFDWTQAGHAVVKACEAVDWNLEDPAEFIKRVQLIEYGLSAETEFAAILSWLGRCSLVHRLDQDCYSSKSNSTCCIPDLLAILEHQGVRLPVLIEVKTRKHSCLKIRSSEVASMRRYAASLSLPLLFAWKPRRLGFWLLVDPIHFVEKDGKSILELDSAMKNNLLSCVAGDFLVVPKKGADLVLEAKIVKKTRSNESGFEEPLKITHMEFHNADGVAARNVSEAILAIVLSCNDVVQEVYDDRIRISFRTRDEPITTQQVLRTAIACHGKPTKPIKWRHFAKDLDSYLSSALLHAEIQKHFGTFVQYQFFLHPQAWPTFLPEAWNAVS